MPNNWPVFSAILQGIAVAWCLLGICLQYCAGRVRQDQQFIYVGSHADGKLSAIYFFL
jgi:hypothetical protein